MVFRGVTAFAGVVLLSCLVSGCVADDPDPTPTPLFATEEEAFAAAEATYRAYVDALNEVDLADPATFEPVYALMTPAASADVRKEFSQMHADGQTVEGDSRVARVAVQSANLGLGQIELAVCLDVSAVEVRDREGVSLVTPDRPPVQPMSVSLTPDRNKDLLISSIDGRSGEPSCAA